MSNFSDFLSENDLTVEQVVAESQVLEARDTEQRELETKRAAARREKKSYDEAGAQKPEGLGRGASFRTVKDAVQGKPLPRVGRKKITRAVNAILQAKSKDPVDSRLLFADAPLRRGKAKKK